MDILCQEGPLDKEGENFIYLKEVRYFTRFALLLVFPLLAVGVFANHSWGTYHWGRTANPFTLKLGDNVSSAWDGYLSEAAADWSASNVLDLLIVAGNGGRNCGATLGRVEVCNRKYGNNGWLGIAQIWVSGSHITKAVAKMNDTYFTKATYNTPAWRRLVMCQEVAHTFGLDHQDEEFGNVNLGTCMDYTADPDGPPSNEHPNSHDFEQLEVIYEHLDSTNTLDMSQVTSAADVGGSGRPDSDGFDTQKEWGRQVKDNGNVGLYVRELASGQKLFTHVFWALK